MTKGLTNSVTQRIFIGGFIQPSPPLSYADGPLIMIMLGLRMEGIASCDADGHGRKRDPRGNDGEYCAGDRCEVVGSDGGENPCPNPPDA